MNQLFYFIHDGVNVVGNASSLKEKKLGEEIDSLPTIRFNWIELDKAVTGARKDIVCTNFPGKLKQQYKYLIADRSYHGIDTYVYPVEIRKDLSKRIGMKPSNGCRVLYLLDQFRIQNVNVYGFDWKETPTMIVKQRISTPENEHHDYKKEKEFCLELIEKNKWTLK